MHFVACGVIGRDGGRCAARRRAPVSLRPATKTPELSQDNAKRELNRNILKIMHGFDYNGIFILGNVRSYRKRQFV